MRIAILGSGAMACLFGARLAPHADVTLLGTWAEGIEAIAEFGIRIAAGPHPPAPSPGRKSNDAAGPHPPAPSPGRKSGDAAGPHPPAPSPGRKSDDRERGSEAVDDTAVVRVRATTDLRRAAPADIALVLVKSWQTERAARQAAEILVPDGLALTLQNGLGNLEKLAAAVGADQALPGVTTMGATLLGPGLIREGGRGPVSLPDDPRLAPFVAALRAANFEVHPSPIPNLQSLIWGKVVINCGINALTAILRVPNGELLERPDARRLMEHAAQEAADVARALDVQLPFTDPALRVRQVARATAANHSSMFQDILRGAPTEIEAINGAVVREGERLGVATPVNEVLWRLVRAV